MKRCYFCRAEMERRRIRHVHEWGKRIYIFENVPADVCRQCGESYFDPETLKKIDAIVDGGQESKREERVPVYSL